VLAVAATKVVAMKLPATKAQADPPVDPKAAAVRTAERLVQGRAAELKASPGDQFVRQQDISTPWVCSTSPTSAPTTTCP
jgi:hypothetical protein